MERLIEDLEENKEWRIGELSQLKVILNHENIHNEANYNFLSKYAIPTACAIWEGFFKEAIGNYFSFFNRNSKIEKDLEIITNIIIHNDIIKINYQDFDSKKRLVNSIKDVLNNPQFRDNKPRVGLQKLGDTNKFLERIKLDPINFEYSSKLNPMIDLRNTIFHGEKSERNLSYEEIEIYINFIIELMNILSDNIVNKATELLMCLPNNEEF